nr:hypothetical protein [uncultured Draconibacterium sp.]
MKTIMFKMGILLFALILLNNCEKENCENCDENADSEPAFIIGADNGFVDITTFGTGNGISIYSLDDSGNNYNSVGLISFSDSVGFDVDKDSVVDFYLSNSYGETAHGTHIMGAGISVSNSDFKISVVEIPDTLYRCTTVHYFPQDDTTYTIETYVIYNTSYSCNGDDTISSVEINSYPCIYSIGDTLNHTETWLSKHLKFGYKNYSSGIATGGQTEYSVVYGNWIGEFDKFVLFKKEANETVLYGWFKLSVFNDCGETLYEYAIQKTNIE